MVVKLRHPGDRFPSSERINESFQISTVSVGDSVGLTVDGDLFVACEECGFPVCRPCYEYERREGTQVCPQCHTRYKRIKGNWKLSY